MRITFMRYIYSLVLIFVLTSSGICQGIILPGEVKAGAFPFVTITAQTEGKTVRWFFDSPYLQFLPLKIDDPKSTVIMLAKDIPEGRYKVWAYTALNGEATPPAMTLIVVGEGPEPGPGPTPPGPSTPFEKNIASAFLADGSPTEKALQLAALYREAGEKTVDDTSLKTAGDLFRVMKDAANQLVSPSDLGSVRKTIADYLNGKLPTSTSAVLTLELRQTAKALFGEVATALEKLKK